MTRPILISRCGETKHTSLKLNSQNPHQNLPFFNLEKHVTLLVAMSPDFIARGELSAWLANQAVRRKQWKICNRFMIVSSSAGAFMHSLSGR